MKRYTLIFLIALGLAGLGNPSIAQVQMTNNAFNPAMSLILDGKFAAYSGDFSGFDFAGFPLDEEVSPPPEGLSLGESEFVLSANVDDLFYGFMTVALHQDEGSTEVELEEAWIETLSLPGGLGVKAGAMYSDIGYQNSRHPHTWDFVDAPLPYAVMLGGNFADTGVQLRWLAPTDLMLEMGAELLRGESYPASGAGNSGTGAWTAFARLGGDLGDSQSWRLGLSYLSGKVVEREYDPGVGPGTDLGAFSGDSSVAIVDAVWKWAENGNPRQRNLVIQAEYLLREEDGLLDMAGDNFNGSSPYDISQDGFYIQGTYQFRPSWRVGLRYDRVSADNAPLLPPLEGLLETAGSPSRVTAMLDYSRSEFSRLRFQVANLDNGRRSDSQVMLQYIMSIGAHGAHQF
ncbi:MAG: TonB-dependent receptor [Chromatiales bacterium]|nr:TonB-dependent receptor [Chromatiales bacterium]